MGRPGTKSRAHLLVFPDCAERRGANVGDDDAGVGLARPPDLEPSRDAAHSQDAARLELGIPAILNQDRTLKVDAVALSPLAADARRLNDYAVDRRDVGVAHGSKAFLAPALGQVGVGRNATNATWTLILFSPTFCGMGSDLTLQAMDGADAEANLASHLADADALGQG